MQDYFHVYSYAPESVVLLVVDGLIVVSLVVGGLGVAESVDM